MIIHKFLTHFGRYLQLMGRTFSRPERMRMFFKQYVKEMAQLGVDSIGIVLLISFFIGAVIVVGAIGAFVIFGKGHKTPPQKTSEQEDRHEED